MTWELGNEFGTVATLRPASDDVAYLTGVRAGAIDLDPSAGTFAVDTVRSE